jgi:hypothetical protein
MFGRIVVAFVMIGALAALGAYWIGPGVVPRAQLRLLALDAESRFAEEADLPAAERSPGEDVLQPLILAVGNTGARASGVQSITLATPGWIRLHGADGPIEPAEDRVDEPLRKYVFTLDSESIEPGALPRVPASLGRMWVSIDAPAITCRLRWDGVPEFVPAPPWNTVALRHVAVFYSVEGERGRHTGVLRLGLDAAGVPREPAPYSAGDPVVRRPGVTIPPTDSLVLHGERTVTCGAPDRRVELHIAVWRTAEGWLRIVTHGGLPRRLLFDENGDGRIERELWDGDADGLFEASRTTSYTPPAYLMPVVTARVDTVPIDAARVDSARVDSAGVDTVSVDTTARVRGDTVPVDTTARGDVVPASIAGRVR